MLKNIRLLISEEEKLKQHGVRVKIIGNVYMLIDCFSIFGVVGITNHDNFLLTR